jgi:hypothetical protein
MVTTFKCRSLCFRVRQRPDCHEPMTCDKTRALITVKRNLPPLGLMLPCAACTYPPLPSLSTTPYVLHRQLDPLSLGHVIFRIGRQLLRKISYITATSSVSFASSREDLEEKDRLPVVQSTVLSVFTNHVRFSPGPKLCVRNRSGG